MIRRLFSRLGKGGPKEGSPVHHRGFNIPRHLAWRTGTLANFTAVSDNHIEALTRFGGLADAVDVVEIGCGVGRDAIALLSHLPNDGTYLGIDIMPDSIAWAQKNIAATDKRFAFVHFNVADKQHNPSGTEAMDAYAVPREDGTVDLIFLFSVFTHMFPGDLARYMGEFARILRPGGRVLASMFVIHEGLPAHLEKIGGGGARNLTFQHEVEPGFFHNDPAKVPGATGYSLQRLEEEAAKAGLKVEAFARGQWSLSGGHEVPGQDILTFSLA